MSNDAPSEPDGSPPEVGSVIRWSSTLVCPARRLQAAQARCLIGEASRQTCLLTSGGRLLDRWLAWGQSSSPADRSSGRAAAEFWWAGRGAQDW